MLAGYVNHAVHKVRIIPAPKMLSVSGVWGHCCGCCSVHQLCPAACDPMNCSMPDPLLLSPGVCSNSYLLSR